MKEKQTVDPEKRKSISANLLLLFISFYRYAISPFLPSRCRYFPTCSSYADESVRRYGAMTGGWLAIKRLSRCHPWGSHGLDPVPDLSPNSSHCCQRKP